MLIPSAHAKDCCGRLTFFLTLPQAVIRSALAAAALAPDAVDLLSLHGTGEVLSDVTNPEAAGALAWPHAQCHTQLLPPSLWERAQCPFCSLS